MEFTAQGIKNLKDYLHNILIFKAHVERSGDAYHGTFSPAGRYDAASLIQADDDNDNSVKECVLEAEKPGNVHSTTLKIYLRKKVRNLKIRYTTFLGSSINYITNKQKKSVKDSFLMK